MSRICMVVDGNYPQDIRVRKEAESLAAIGKDVLIVCPKRKGLQRNETVNGVAIFRIGRNYTNWQKGIYDIIVSVLNINPFFYVGLKKVFKKYQVDYLHVHDLPLAGTCYLFRKKVSKKLILDLHENFPEAMKTWFLWRKNALVKLKNKIFMNPGHWSIKEGKYSKKYDVIVCVVDEMKEKLISKYKLDTNKLVVISNHEKKSFRDNFTVHREQQVIDEKDFSITYVGGFGPHRGLDTCIEAMPEILKTVPEAKLYLIGKGTADVENNLKALVRANKLEKSVAFVGYRPFEEIPAIMRKSSINTIPHHADEHTNNTIPHKLFQIMLSEQLLLVSSCKPLKRIVEKYDGGVVFEAGDPLDFANKVCMIHNERKKYLYKIKNAFDAVMFKGENWEQESEKLIELYSQ